ncbi:class I SAM-dependent methyltransferase [Arthrobacter sp. M4]|uniref:class I SAM-dependent methyltransferase n=1 Tax=Arthrobacter sp. M4 TaxID=218160 RepID=UPI001CDCC06C|nr:class I SAM-dependent methyltransferase [Arthrobacter sp. M4]MCA4131445.1 class I SAM-dependent methyltransferase [Arthrobacter sp. M4]
MTVFLRERAADAVEEMDRPDCDPLKLDRSYSRFRIVNRVVSGWNGIYRDLLRPVLASRSYPTLLDIGCGGGDVARRLASLAAKDGLNLRITAIDPDERAFRFAVGTKSNQGITFRQAYSSELVAEGRRFDAVISNHILHHLTSVQLQELLHDSEALCRDVAIHNDLERNVLAYGLFGASAWTLAFGSFILRDGLTSIRRSYTPRELQDAAPLGWRVEHRTPFRNVLVYRPGDQQ